VDGVGNLAMTSNGYNVMGWQVDPETMDIKKDTVSALRVMSAENMTYPPEATTKAYVAGILDQNDTDVTSSIGKTMNLQFYDNLGYSYTAKLIVKNTDVEGAYTVQLDRILDSNNIEQDIEGVTFGAPTPVEKAITKGLADGYAWVKDAGGTFSLQQNGTTVYTMGSTTTTASGTVQNADGEGDLTAASWEILAKAYNVDTEDAVAMAEFKTMAFDVDYTYPNTITDPAGTETANGTVSVTLEQLFLGATDIEVTTAATDGEATATGNESISDLLKLTTIADINEELKTLEIDRYSVLESASLTFDQKTGKFVGIGGDGNPSLTLAL